MAEEDEIQGPKLDELAHGLKFVWDDFSVKCSLYIDWLVQLI